MSEIVEGNYMNKATLSFILKIEKRYQENFEKQAEFLKEITNKAMKSSKNISGMSENSHKDPFTFLLDFLGRGNEGREELAKKILNDKAWNSEKSKILFLGIQNLTRSKNAHLKKKVSKECKKEEKQEIQNCLKSIFCEDDGALREEPKIDNLEFIFDKPTSTVTSVLYWLYPEKYIPFDQNSKKLYEKLFSNSEDIKIEDNWNSYDNILNALKKSEFFKNNGDLKASMIIALSFAAVQEDNSIERILSKLIDKDTNRNIILTGIPGTGKTYSINDFLENNGYKDKNNSNYNRFEFVQFHPSYDYEDFIEGLKPIPSDKNEQIEFKLVDGIFKKLCKKAFESQQKKENKTYVMVIDEINRANLSRVFGELLYCLEYRDEFVSTKMTTYIESLKDEEAKIEHSIDVNDKENIGKFTIPSNLIILGTMNEVDRSIDAFDLALRRRFIWEDIEFNEMKLRLNLLDPEKKYAKELEKSDIENLIERANKLNKKLAGDIGDNYKIGHTYYFKIIDYYFKDDFDSALCDVWDYHIKSLVREYCKIKFGENELGSKLEEYKEIVVGKKNCNA